MCGIAGIIRFNDELVDPKILANMIRVVKHRGPDANGIVLMASRDGGIQRGTVDYNNQEIQLSSFFSSAGSIFNVGLAHARLNIIDLSDRAVQPMCNTDKSLWIVYNGEVYNYLEIRSELLALGYQFASDSDTEVILYAYQQWGEHCLSKFNGMWSFAIWDQRKQILFCARDRFAVKPFYYYFNGDVFVFASEIKQILEYPEYNRSPNDKIIYDYLIIGLEDHTKETFFENVYKLAGGEYGILDIKKRSFQKNKFYALSSIEVLDHEEEDYYRYFLELFTNSVKLRLRSDVLVGSCLSGGIDSSAVVSIISTLLTPEQRALFNTFTACWDDNVIDERPYSEAIVESAGVNGNFVYPSCDDLATELSSLIWHQEEPFGSLSIFAQWAVMKASRLKGVTVLLDGQGGDEVFLGYERYYAWILMDFLRRSQFFQFTQCLVAAAQNSKLGITNVLLYYLYFNFDYIRSLRIRLKASNFVNKHFMRQFDLTDRLSAIGGISTVKGLQIREIMDIQLPHLLKYADRNSMAFSIETRLPFLDYRLVEYALSIPSGYMVKNGWTKNVIRSGLNGILPEHIRKRKNKIGFEAPQRELLTRILPSLRVHFKNDAALEEYINKPWFEQMLNSRQINHLTLWRSICLGLWLNRFFGGNSLTDLDASFAKNTG